MESLKELIRICEGSIDIEINGNRDCYESIEQYIPDEDKEEIPSDVYAKMIDINTVVRLWIYPNTPVSFFTIYHYDIEAAIDRALREVQLIRKQKADA